MAGVADDDGRAALQPHARQRLPHHGGPARRLDREVDAARAEPRISATGSADRRVDHVRSAELPGERELVRVHIDRDDGHAPGRCAPPRPRTSRCRRCRNREALSRPRLRGVEHHAGAGRDRRSPPARPCRSRHALRASTREAVLADDGVRGEGGDRAGVHLAAVPVVDAAGDVRAAALDPGEDDAVAGLHLGDAGTDFANDAAALVAETVRQEPVFAAVAAGFEDLRVADAAERDFDENLPGFSAGISRSASSSGPPEFRPEPRRSSSSSRPWEQRVGGDFTTRRDGVSRPSAEGKRVGRR